MPCDPRDLHTQTEEYEYLGTVETYSLDLRKRFDELSAARHVVVTDEEADLILDHDYPVPPAVLWDYLSDPVRRDRWMPGRHWSAGGRPGGRTGPGAQNHCAHGKNETVTELILDWKPFRYATTRQFLSPDRYFTMSNVLTPAPDGSGTHLHTTMAGHLAQLPRVLARPLTRFMMNVSKFPQTFDSLAVLIARDLAAPAPVEADVAVSATT